MALRFPSPSPSPSPLPTSPSSLSSGGVGGSTDEPIVPPGDALSRARLGRVDAALDARAERAVRAEARAVVERVQAPSGRLLTRVTRGKGRAKGTTELEHENSSRNAVVLARGSDERVDELGDSLGQRRFGFLARLLEFPARIRELDLTGQVQLAHATSNPAREVLQAEEQAVATPCWFLFEHLQHSTRLETLVLNANRLISEDLVPIARLLRSVPTLRKLCLAGNWLARHTRDVDGRGQVSDSLQHPSIGHVLSAKVMAKAVPDGICDLRDAIAVNLSLQHLDLSDNELKPNHVTAIANGVQANETLVHLNVSGNDVGLRGGWALVDAVRKNPTSRLVEVLLGNGPSPGLLGGKRPGTHEPRMSEGSVDAVAQVYESMAFWAPLQRALEAHRSEASAWVESHDESDAEEDEDGLTALERGLLESATKAPQLQLLLKRYRQELDARLDAEETLRQREAEHAKVAKKLQRKLDSANRQVEELSVANARLEEREETLSMHLEALREANKALREDMEAALNERDEQYLHNLNEQAAHEGSLLRTIDAQRLEIKKLKQQVASEEAQAAEAIKEERKTHRHDVQHLRQEVHQLRSEADAFMHERLRAMEAKLVELEAARVFTLENMNRYAPERRHENVEEDDEEDEEDGDDEYEEDDGE